MSEQEQVQGEGLIISRKKGEQIQFTTPGGEEILITFLELKPGRVRVRVKAPQEIRIRRGETVDSKEIA
jgi:carbon storage regulator CsrA